MNLKDLVIKEVEGISLVMPTILANNWPVLPLDEFPSFCGAGSGIKEKAIPETMMFLSVRHNCFIHDVMFTVLSPIPFHWHMANYIMLINNLETIRVNSNFVTRPIRSQIALGYFAGVETKAFGYRAFTNRTWVENYLPENDINFKLIMASVGVPIDGRFDT